MKQNHLLLVVFVLMLVIFAAELDEVSAQRVENQSEQSILRRIDELERSNRIFDIVTGVIATAVGTGLFVFSRKLWNSVQKVEGIAEEVKVLRNEVNELAELVNYQINRVNKLSNYVDEKTSRLWVAVLILFLGFLISLICFFEMIARHT